MSISVGWDNEEQTVICYHFNGTWTWEDMEVALETSFNLTESVSHKVHVIIDFRNSTGLPHGLILKVRQVLQVTPSNRGSIVVVGACAEAKALLRMAGRIHKVIASRITTADNFVDAYAVLRLKPNPAHAMDINVLRPANEVPTVTQSTGRAFSAFAGLTAMFR